MSLRDGTRPAFGETPLERLLLGAIMALSALAVDVSLPAIPALSHALGATANTGQLIVTVYLVGFAAGQLVWGGLSDRYGRKKVLITAYALFGVMTVVATLAPTIEVLIAARGLQGVAGAAAPLLARAIVRDVASGQAGARLMSTLTAVMGTAPLMAPVLGSLLLTAFDWRATFGVLVPYVLLLVFFVSRKLPETNAAYLSGTVTRLHPLAVLKAVFGNGRSRFGLLMVCLPFAGYLSVITGASPVFIEVFKVPEVAFGFVFAAATVAYVGGSMMSRRLLKSHSVDQLVRWGLLGIGAGAGTFLLLFATGSWSLAGVIGAIALYLFGTGMMLPNATAIALEPFPHMAGSAAAILGSLQIGAGSLLSAVVAHGYNGTPAALALTVGGAGVASCIAYRLARS